MSLNVRTWRLKIEALLLPTPLAELDPDGEKARVAEVRGIFALPAPGDDDAALLEDARWDAGDAQAAGAPETEVLPTPRPDHLLHPLDPTTRWDAPARSAVEGAWRGLLERVREIGWAGDDAAALAGAYRRLWWEFAGERVFQQQPHTWRMPDHSLFAHRSLTAAITGARAAGGEAALMLAQTGPVQETIEASRRTSDLWMGSFLYSYLSYHALAKLVDELGPDAIISPHPRELALAEMGIFKGYGDTPREEQRVQPSLPAKVLAVVPRAMAKALADRVSDTILETWQAMAGAVRAWVEKLKPPPPQGWDCDFNEQIDAALERGVLVLPWPKEVEQVRGFLQEVWWGSKEGASAGALYGPMSGVLWRLSSAAGRASLPPRHKGDPRRKCTVCGEREQLGPVPKDGDTPKVREEKERFWKDLAMRISEPEDTALEVGDIESTQVKIGEGLCAVCLTRRFAPEIWFGGSTSPLGLRWANKGDRKYLRFPSVASVAAAPFREIVLGQSSTSRVGAPLAELVPLLDQLHDRRHLSFTPPSDLIPGLTEFGKRTKGTPDARRLCAFDGTWMDSDAFEAERAWRDHKGRPPPREGERGFENYRRLSTPLRAARDAFGALCRAVEATPSAYYAVLYLDGDQMSHWLNGIHDRTPLLREVLHPSLADRVPATQKRPVFPALQSELSRRLSSLAAGEVAKIVHAHLGRLVYCGGDDVVALLPLITALPCAEAIYKLLRSDAALGQRATASAGLVFAHWRDPLGPVLRAARSAEKRAKADQVLYSNAAGAPAPRDREDRLTAAYSEALGFARLLPLRPPRRDRDEDGRPVRLGRDRLAIRVEVRSGSPLELVLPWGFGDGSRRWGVMGALQELVGLPDRTERGVPAVSLAFGYTLRDEVKALSGIPMGLPTRLWAALGKRLGGSQDERLPRALRLPFVALAMGDERRDGEPEAADPNQDEALVRGADRAVNTILFARFLAREARGIDLDAILPEVR